MLQVQTQNCAPGALFCSERYSNHVKEGSLGFCTEENMLTKDISIPDICQHKPATSVEAGLGAKVPGRPKDLALTLTSNKDSEESDESCDSSSNANAESRQLSANEEKINQVTSQALLVRQNSLRLVARSPVGMRRGTPIVELDRRWALDQCEVSGTTPLICLVIIY